MPQGTVVSPESTAAATNRKPIHLPTLVFSLLLLVAIFLRIQWQRKPPPATAPAQTVDQLRQQLEEILKQTHTAGMSVAIVRSDGPEWVAGLGQADLAAHRSATADTLFRIGSISKVFVSLSVLKLVEERKLSLQDPVHRLVPEIWFENRWEATDPVRVADLLEHTTGWNDMDLREGDKNGHGMTLLQALDYDHHSRISRWPPGTLMSYCSSGPSVAAYIVEKITGQRFSDYVAQNLFRPIGMNTATYFEQPSSRLTTQYESDGTTPVPYWHILLRPSGAINASARDMAAYLQFLLNRGQINGRQVVPGWFFDQMQTPTRTRAARAGLRAGYGLSDYTMVHDGFVYYGHDGFTGGRSEIAYLPRYGIGYYFSINTNHPEAFDRIGGAIRALITRDLVRPPVPASAPLPADAQQYAGWYELAAPRHERLHFLQRLALTHVYFRNGNMLVSTGVFRRIFVPVAGEQFRYVPAEGHPDPIATAMLLAPNSGGRLIELPYVLGEIAMQRLPEWQAILQLACTFWFLFACIAVLVYSAQWILDALRKRRLPEGFAIRLWPLFAVLSIVAFFCLGRFIGDEVIHRLATLTFWSFGLFLTPILFAGSSLASAASLWLTRRQPIDPLLRWFSVGVTIALLIATAYLAWWGVIGFRTWS